MRQIASALDAAHESGVMHRDVKPENIILTRDDFAYLVDFGIANAATDEKLTELGTAVGTYAYMAPERFTNDEVTYRADVYALTCVLHECLTGSQPYSGDSVSVVITAHLMQPIPKPSEERPGIPPAFDRVIAIGMAKKPARSIRQRRGSGHGRERGAERTGPGPGRNDPAAQSARDDAGHPDTAPAAGPPRLPDTAADTTTDTATHAAAVRGDASAATRLPARRVSHRAPAEWAAKRADVDGRPAARAAAPGQQGAVDPPRRRRGRDRSCPRARWASGGW